MVANIHDDLKKLVLLKCGINEITVQDCKEISHSIFIQDKNYLSEHTIRGVFGLKPMNGYSLFVCDCLSQFVGYQHYAAFLSEQ
ncbi:MULTISPECIES: hypothetical protein [Pedobacter]|uniref:hypothetical protein n=1 Tax=Pedobacter TaxID=84567 RepID=UPI001E39EAE9|nr:MULTISPECIES: hypothetical protein [Pedobacter]